MRDGKEEETDLRSESGGLLKGAEKLPCFFPLGVLDFVVVEKTDGWTAPYEPMPVILDAPTVSQSVKFQTPVLPFPQHWRDSVAERSPPVS